ncbi:MAG: MlaD family protein, partial [Mycolicibacterium vanbaalenii]|uniref:MlaD family protein n=1 Tax=Mycolicibacterium vanbaalenii TaxID=110539 RepID=UPI0035633307
MTRSAATLVKFTAFGLVMALLTAFLFLVFSDTRTGAANEYTAVFTDASRLKSGDTVRIAGIRVGTV